MKRIFVFLLMFFIPVTTIQGFYCKYSEISKYKNLASNINTHYDYVETDSGVSFSVTLTNLTEELYIVDVINDKTYTHSEDELTITGYEPGQTVKYYVYTTNENCSDKLLYTIRVILPSYNPYYNLEICNGIENYIYCQKWYGHNLKYDDFVNKVNDYKLSLIKKPTEPTPQVQSGVWFYILKWFIDYYYIVLPTIIVVSSVIIYYVNKKSDVYK